MEDENINQEVINDSNLSIKKKNVKKNYIYNLIYQIFLLIVPLVLTPYVSRVLGADGVGKYSFSYSLITYFTILANIGFTYYGQREIAKYQNDDYSKSKAFWEILICRFLFVIISLGLNLILYSLNVYGSYSQLMLILSINVLAVGFDVTYYFQGNEEFGKIVTRNAVIKLLSIVLIIWLVNDSNDLWVYTLINSGMLIISNISLWTYLPKLLKKIKLEKLKPFSHLKGTLILFLPTIATSVYVILDKTLIGLLIPGTYTEIIEGVEVFKKISDLENGYYEQAEKLVKMTMTVITAIGTVMIPRNSKEFADGHINKVKENIYSTSSIVWLIGIPMVLGLIAVSSDLVPWFLGSGYDKVSILMPVLSPIILIIGFSNVFGIQYLVPTGQDKKFTVALIVGAVTNLILNLIFIPFWYSIGAAIATVIAETAVTVTMMIMVRKQLSIKRIFSSIWKYLIAGTIMFGSVFVIAYFMPEKIYSTITEVGAGIVIYYLMLMILKEKYSTIYTKKVLNKFHKKRKKEKK